MNSSAQAAPATSEALRAVSGLHPVTSEVRDFYERYPYPASATPMLRSGFDIRYVASLGAIAPPVGERPKVLDAGCGRGVGVLANATANPNARFTGIDLNRVALREARSAANARGLTNASFEEIDLMTLEGLEVPEGGFDLIYSSGVVHHLEDPAYGLQRLREVLAPHGVISFMVYGAAGRQDIRRVARTVEAAIEATLPLELRLSRARDLVSTLADRRDKSCPFTEASIAPDAEFVDRYLHPNEQAYEVPALFDLIENAGLQRLAWADPGAWSSERWVPAGAARTTVEALDERERFATIEQLAQPLRHELYLARPENERRELPDRSEWKSQLFACHPEVRFEVSSRNLWCENRVEGVAYVRRDGERVEIPSGPLAHAVFLLSSQSEPFYGETLFNELATLGLNEADSCSLIADLMARELIYSPHASELTR
jgi:SAM-dependent methyltransferase